MLWHAGTCTDVPPSKYFTCAQQKGFGKCNESFMRGYCNQSCGRCNASGTISASPSQAEKMACSCIHGVTEAVMLLVVHN